MFSGTSPDTEGNMKINRSRHTTEGSVLIITVITLFVLTTMAVSYLFILQNDNRLVGRDQLWNRALVVAEAGVEEGMAHVNSLGALSTPRPDFSGDTWSASGTNYTMTRSTNFYGGGYSVLVGGPSNIVTITSTGMVTAPLSGTTLRRVVQVTAPFTSGFQLGIAAITSITMNGNNITTDSYDSSDTNDFPGGLYNSLHRMDHGDVASLDTNFFSIGNANIMGKVHMPPGAKQQEVTIGPNGSVGSVAYVTGGSTDFEGGNPSPYFAADFNMTFPDVQAPYSGGSAPGTNALTSGDYYVNGNFSGNLTVASYQYVELYVTGTFNVSTVIVQSGGTLVVYIGGPSATLGTVNNQGNANNFQIYGLPSLNSTISMSGNAEYIGTVYAPEATFKFNGGGTDTLDFQGAVVAKAFDVNGHFNMHYDQNLAREPIAGTYVTSSWTELLH